MNEDKEPVAMGQSGHASGKMGEVLGSKKLKPVRYFIGDDIELWFCMSV